ncbi:MAG TPA: preprotein translocase subunit SecG [Pyrinomonadaceae bacterium]
MLYYLLYILFILACIVLVISVLLQPGKADAGSLFTSSISSTAFGPRGTQTILAKITIGAAATFFIVALLLGLGVGGGQHSLMEGGVTPQATPAPAASPAAPAEGAAPAASPAASPAEGAAAPSTPAASPAATPATTASPATK